MRAGLAAAVLLLAGCAAAPTAPGESRVDVDNPELRAAKADIGIATCPSVSGSSELPDLTLHCLGGGRDVKLSDVPGPAVITLWATWCGQCHDELPLYQRLAKEAPDRLTVLGVDYTDMQPGGALELLRETGATFPQLADPGGNLADHYQLTGLPAYLMVDDAGKVTFQKRRIATYAELAGLVEDHTGVALAAR